MTPRQRQCRKKILRQLTIIKQRKSIIDAEGQDKRKMSLDKEEGRGMIGKNEEAYGLGKEEIINKKRRAEDLYNEGGVGGH